MTLLSVVPLIQIWSYVQKLTLHYPFSEDVFEVDLSHEQEMVKSVIEEAMENMTDEEEEEENSNDDPEEEDNAGDDAEEGGKDDDDDE